MSPCASNSSIALSIDAEWDNMCCDDLMNEASTSSGASTNKIFPSDYCVGKVLEEWTSDEESLVDDVDMEIMEVDEQIGSNFLSEDIFFGHCASPVSPQEEFSMNMGNMMDNDKFCLEPPILTQELPAPVVIDDRYREAFAKLAESMKKSQETRACLSITPTVANNNATKASLDSRRKTISQVLESIEKSSEQLRTYFGDEVLC